MVPLAFIGTNLVNLTTDERSGDKFAKTFNLVMETGVLNAAKASTSLISISP